MNTKKECSKIGCLLHYRFELLGLLLIVIASVLTIINMDSLGIVAMFVIGALLCCHQCYIKSKSCEEKQEANKNPQKNRRPRRQPRKPQSEKLNEPSDEA